jgi:peptidoglycan/xylan/chitin deacetylase (PgdA/CDA1 family)
MELSEGQRYLAYPTPVPIISPTPHPYFAGANELGKILVLEYHRLGYPELRYQRTPDNLRLDLERLYQSGYYPVNFIDLVRGLPNVPAGKKPVVLTFDDSDISQFQVLGDNTIDADSVVGILLNFHSQHPQEWPTRATFFILGNDTPTYYAIFGQPEWAKAKVNLLVDLGMEVGSHTVSHIDLSTASAERIYWELAVSQHVLEELLPDYQVQSLSVPFGGFPYTLEFLKAGQWGDFSYTYAGNAAAWGGPAISPFDPTFEPYHISRVEVTDTSIDYWLTYFDLNPHEYYVSDGAPSRVTAPPHIEVAAQQQ